MKNNRFNRQILMFGQAGQERIENQLVGVVGAGGLGSPICQSLAYLGVRNFGIIDDDRLDETNLNRQAGAFPSDVGQIKVEAVKAHILRVNPEAQVRIIPRNLRTREALEFLTKCNCIVGGLDHDGPRLVLTELAAAYRIALIDVATQIFPATKEQPFDFGGRVVVAKPGDYCLCCADQLDLELAKQDLETAQVRAARRNHGYGIGTDGPAPSVFALNGILANAAVMEFLVMVTGIREPARHLTYKGMRGVMTSRTDGHKPGCYFCEYVCGQREKTNIWRYLLPEQPESKLAA